MTGHPTTAASTPWLRSASDRWLFGVCSGTATRFAIPAGVVRLLFAIAGVTSAGIWVYLGLALVLPRDDGTGHPAPGTGGTRRLLLAMLVVVVVVVALLVFGLAGSTTSGESQPVAPEPR